MHAARQALALALAVSATASPTVSELDLPKYLGRWYQVASSAPTLVFETRYCVTADYGTFPNSTISVVNKDRKGSVTGEQAEVDGWAEVKDSSKPGQLGVHFFGASFGAPYYVYELGPVVDGEYQYSIVSDPLKVTLFVLSRNVTTYYAKYDATVQASLTRLGFTNLVNKPLETYHDGCVYDAPAKVDEAALALQSSTVPALDVSQYLGRWYQVASSAPTLLFATRYCVTADYGAGADGIVTVLNQDRKKSVTGEPSKIAGTAKVSDPSKPGQLTVKLDGVPVPAPYYVYELGPVVDGEYQYSIVSDPLKVTLFVLSRNVTTYYAKYDATVQASLTRLGFTNLVNKPLKTYQEGCVYN